MFSHHDLNGYIHSLQEEWVRIRRDLHKIPELSNREFETQRYIMDYLDQIGIENRPVADTGVYAILRTGIPGPNIAFRADMDALPLSEEAKLPYASKHPGCMHACGHDAHMTFVLGLARVLGEMRAELCGNIVFLFQPAEENMEGAGMMLRQGVLNDPVIEAIFSAHVWNLPAGQILVKPGPVMASATFFQVKMLGKGGHGAQPHACCNPISAGAHVVEAFESCAATMIDPLEPVVVSVCSFRGGDACNVIPASAELLGTIRTYNDEIYKLVCSKLDRIAKNIAAAYQCDYSFEVLCKNAATINDRPLAEWAYATLAKSFDKKQLLTDLPPAMTGEDFGFFGKYVPSLFLWIGVANQRKKIISELHNPEFNIDEDVLSDGVAAFASLALGKCLLQE